MSAYIQIEGLDRVIGKLENLQQLNTVKAGIKAAAIHVKGKIAEYPPRKHIPMRWKSERQRRWFFAALRSGAIDVPYKRGSSPGSEGLGRRWTVKERDDGLSAVVGNNVSYGPFVQREDSQYWMHKASGWKTTARVANEERSVVVDFVTAAIRKAL